MTQHPNRLRALHLTAKACFFALAFSGAVLTHTVAEAKTSAPEVDERAAKSPARLQAEKMRAMREARERGEFPESQVASARAPSAPVAKPEADIAGYSDSRFSLETSIFVSAAAEKLGLSPKTSARTAGFLVGMGGTWVYSKVMGATAASSVGLDRLALEAADVGVAYLQERYAVAERMGRAARYILAALMAAGICVVGHKTLSRRSARVSRRTATMGQELSDMADKSPRNFRNLFSIFGRKQEQAIPAQEQTEAIVAPFDLEVLRDYAYNLLFARGRHDLAGVGDMVTASFARCLITHFQTLEAAGHWNKVERVSGVTCNVAESWQEGDTSYAKLKVTWQALDYVVNFNRRPGEHGYIVDGSPNKLDSFDEEWIVLRKAGGTWLVDSMYPCDKKHPLIK